MIREDGPRDDGAAASSNPAPGTARSRVAPDLRVLISMVGSGDPNQVAKAAEVLADLGPTASPAIPALARALLANQDFVDYDTWTQSLRRAHDLGSSHGPVRFVVANEAVARAILAIEPWCDGAVDAHWVLIHRGSPAERRESFAALAKFGARAAGLVPRLAGMAGRGDRDAIKLLGVIGRPAIDAVPVLEDWLKWGPRLSGGQGTAVVEEVTLALHRIRG